MAPAVLNFDIPGMVAVALACVPIFIRDYQSCHWEGALLFAYYIAYTLYLILDATGTMPCRHSRRCWGSRYR